MKLTGTYNRFNNYLLCITLKGREILISKGWLGVGMVGEDISPNLPPSTDSFICSVDSTYFVRNHVVWMIGCTEFRAGIRTKSYRTYHTFLNTQPIFIKQVHRPPNYSKQTFISSHCTICHNFHILATFTWLMSEGGEDSQLYMMKRGSYEGELPMPWYLSLSGSHNNFRLGASVALKRWPADLAIPSSVPAKAEISSVNGIPLHNAFHYINILPLSRYDWNTIEKDIKMQVIRSCIS